MKAIMKLSMRNAIALLLCAVAVCAQDAPRRAPGFALMDGQMKVHDLYDYRGRPVILELMKTDCPHCAAFADVLGKVQQKYGDRIQIIAIANPPDNMTKVKQYIAGHGVTYPVLFDCGQAAYSYVLKQAIDLPQVFLIDAKGMIQEHFEYGPLSRDIFEGDGLMNEVGRVLSAGSTAAKKK